MRKISTFLFSLAFLFSVPMAIGQNRESGQSQMQDQQVLPVVENAKWLTKEAKRPSLGANYKSVFFFENFEAPTAEGALPTGWVQKRTTTLNEEPVADAASPKWFRNSATYGFSNWQDYVYKGAASMATGYTAPDFTWAITPEFTIADEDGDVSLSYWVWFNNAQGWFTNYHVKIKSDGVWTNLFSVIGNADNTNLFETPVVQGLNAFKGKTVQIAFVYEYTDGWQMAIDEIFVGKELENDFGVSNLTVFPTHGLIPGAPVAISADVFCNGNTPGSVNVSLKVNGNVVATHTTGNLVIDGESEFVLFQWVPTAFGDYDIEIVLPADDFIGNNSLTESIYVNHYVKLAEDFENFEFDDLGIPELVFPPAGWSVNDPAWVFATEQWPIFDGVAAALSGRLGQSEKALITSAVNLTDQDEFISFYLEGINNNVTAGGVPQGFATFQLKYSTSASGPWTNLGDPIAFENQYDENNNLIQSANALRFVSHDITALPNGTYYFAFTTTSTFNFSDAGVDYRSFVMVDNVLIGQDPSNAVIPVIYQITIPLLEGNVPYKYFIVVDDPSWDNGEWTGDPNRVVTVTGPATVEDIWGVQPANNKSASQLNETRHLVTFKVDMANATFGADIEFDPALHKVFIAGDFGNGFSWQQPGSQALLELTPQGSVVPVNVGEVNNPASQIQIFPNPAISQFNVRSEAVIQSIEVFSLVGQRVFQQESVNDTQYQISTLGFENGVYLVRIKTANGMATQKLHILK